MKAGIRNLTQGMDLMFDKYCSFIVCVTLALVLSGCSKSVPVTHIVFVDYSSSSPTFLSDNPDRIIERVENILVDMNIGDKLIVYPIHLTTSTSVPLMRFKKPLPNGDLNDRNAADQAKINFINSLSAVMQQGEIPDEIRMGTNLFPVLHKIQGFCGSGPVIVEIFSDMKHEFMDENFNEVFGIHKTDPVQYANDKYMQFNPQPVLSNCAVSMVFPGVTKGELEDELIRHKIILFWTELFSLSGAEVKHMDL